MVRKKIPLEQLKNSVMSKRGYECGFYDFFKKR